MTFLPRALVTASALAFAAYATPSAAVDIPWSPQSWDSVGSPTDFNSANMTFAGVTANSVSFNANPYVHSHGGLVNWSITATINGVNQTIYSSTVNSGNTIYLASLGAVTFGGGTVTSLGFTSSPGQNQSFHGFSGMVFSLNNSAVPEPATWAMMLLGFGGIGMAMRRGKRTSKLALSA